MDVPIYIVACVAFGIGALFGFLIAAVLTADKFIERS